MTHIKISPTGLPHTLLVNCESCFLLPSWVCLCVFVCVNLRVCVRVCPPQNETDETQIQQAGDDVVLPTELAKMIAEDNQEEAHKQSVLGQLSNIQNVDIDHLKDKAQATLEDLKKQTENCSLM